MRHLEEPEPPSVALANKTTVKDSLARAYDMPCSLVLEVPAVQFSVGDLMHLQVGSVVRTRAQQNEDLALHVNGQLVGVVELDVVSDRLAVRILGLA